MLTAEVLAYIKNSVLCWLATVDADGLPNVAPKEVFAAYGGDTIVIADIDSPTSVRNVRAHPQVCVSFVDIFVQQGCKLKGTAEVVQAGDPRYGAMLAPLTKITRGVFTIQSVIAIRVTAVEPIVAPSYRLVPGTTKASQIEAAMKNYGVQPRADGTP